MANNKNGTEVKPQDCPKNKPLKNKLPEQNNDTAKNQPKQNSSKKSQNEQSSDVLSSKLRPVFSFIRACLSVLVALSDWLENPLKASLQKILSS